MPCKNTALLLALIAAALVSQAHPRADSPDASLNLSPPQSASAARPHKRHLPVKRRLVDINSASAKQLMQLPGITEPVAAKLIAHRPYGSKAWLVTQSIMDEAAFRAIEKLIVAKQPYADGNKNAALYQKK